MRKKKYDFIDFIILLLGICFIPYILLFKFLVSLFKNNSKTDKKQDTTQTTHKQDKSQKIYHLMIRYQIISFVIKYGMHKFL